MAPPRFRFIRSIYNRTNETLSVTAGDGRWRFEETWSVKN
jgi:hypothetical protein